MQQLRPIRFVFLGMIGSQLFFMLIVLYLVNKGVTFLDSGMEAPFNIIVPVFALIGIIVGNILYKMRIKIAQKQDTLGQKLQFFKIALILRYAFLEGPSLLAIVCYILVGNYLYLVMSGFLLLMFAAYFPAKFRVVVDLQLSQEEKNKL